MTTAAPTMLALETDSAWVVIVAVSLVTLPAALVLRRVIARPGGFCSGILLGLPLVLPVVAALIYESAALPEIGVLRPVSRALDAPSGSLVHLLLVSDGSGNFVVPYVVTGSAGPWLVVVAIAVVSFMLVRRVLGMVMMRRLIARSGSLDDSARAGEVRTVVASLVRSARLKRTPEILVLPPGVPGAFVVGSSRILLSAELLAELDRQELAAIVAHEIAHLESRDLPVVFAAGFLRDVVAWNPVAHLAYRWLANDRELEADRRAVELTGDPLALASSLLKVFELLRGAGRLRIRAALSLLRPGGRITARVSRLIALADGPPVRLGTISWAPYVVAAVVVAGLGFQVADRVVGDRPSAIAIVLGAPEGSHSAVWSSDRREKTKFGAAANPGGRTRERDKGSAEGRRRARAAYAVRETDLARWSRSITALARRRGIPLEQDWRAVPMFSELSTPGSITVYRIDPKTLLGEAAATGP